MYEVDTPETSAGNRQALAAAGIVIPDLVRFVPSADDDGDQHHPDDPNDDR